MERVKRTRLLASPREALTRLPAMGRIMVAIAGSRISFERIGAVQAAMEAENGMIALMAEAGEEPVALVSTAELAAVDVDRTGRMREQFYPRLLFRDATGRSAFSVVGFGGLEPFDAALAGLAEGYASQEPEPDAPPGPGLASVQPSGPHLHDALTIARDAAQPVEIAMSAGGCTMLTRRVIGELKLAMGFLNIIAADFHLHVREGAIGWWVPTAFGRSQDGFSLIACAPDGRPTPLQLSGRADVFRAHLRT